MKISKTQLRKLIRKSLINESKIEIRNNQKIDKILKRLFKQARDKYARILWGNRLAAKTRVQLKRLLKPEDAKNEAFINALIPKTVKDRKNFIGEDHNLKYQELPIHWINLYGLVVSDLEKKIYRGILQTTNESEKARKEVVKFANNKRRHFDTFGGQQRGDVTTINVDVYAKHLDVKNEFQWKINKLFKTIIADTEQSDFDNALKATMDHELGHLFDGLTDNNAPVFIANKIAQELKLRIANLDNPDYGLKWFTDLGVKSTTKPKKFDYEDDDGYIRISSGFKKSDKLTKPKAGSPGDLQVFLALKPVFKKSSLCNPAHPNARGGNCQYLNIDSRAGQTEILTRIDRAKEYIDDQFGGDPEWNSQMISLIRHRLNQRDAGRRPEHGDVKDLFDLIKDDASLESISKAFSDASGR